METRHTRAEKPARTAAAAGAFVEKTADAVKPSSSALARVGAAASAVKLGARLLPAAWRLIKRYPVASSLAIAALVGAAYLIRPMRTTGRM